MSTYKIYGLEQAEFCQNLYYDSETYFQAERDS